MSQPAIGTASALKIGQQSIKDQDQTILAVVGGIAGMEQRINELTLQGLDATTRRAARSSQLQATKLVQAIRAYAAPSARNLVLGAFTDGARVASASLGSQLPQLGKLDRDALDLLQHAAVTSLDDAAVQLGRQVDDAFRKEGLRSAALHLVAETPHGIETTGMVQRLRKQGLTAFTDKAGRDWSLGTYSSMVLKTTASEAMFTATRDLLLRRGYDLVKVNSVSNPCPRCAEYNGNVYSLTGVDATAEYPLLDVVFPIHPHCRHFAFAAPGANAARAARLDTA